MTEKKALTSLAPFGRHSMKQSSRRSVCTLAGFAWYATQARRKLAAAQARFAALAYRLMVVRVRDGKGRGAIKQ